jgi:hypothetical protein
VTTGTRTLRHLVKAAADRVACLLLAGQTRVSATLKGNSSMTQPRSLVLSSLALWATFGSTALAQTTGAADPDAAPAPPATAPDTNPVRTDGGNLDVTTPTSTGTTLPASSVSAEADERATVVEHSWPNRPLLITGLVVLGGTYGASVIVGAVSDREEDEKLFIPVVGPWLDLKDRDCDADPCGNETLNKTLLIGSGALQGLGAISMVLSLVIPESTQKPWYLIGDEKLSVTPQVGSTTTGLTAFGRF